MAQENNFRAIYSLGRIRNRWIVVALTAIIFTGAAVIFGNQLIESSNLQTAGRYYIRIHSCDDGGRAYVNDTQVIDVGFNEDSNWLEVTEDLTEGSNAVKFEAINKTGAITYVFQVKRNNRIIFERACGKVSEVGCENNRAFRVGVAREFTYAVNKAERR